MDVQISLHFIYRLNLTQSQCSKSFIFLNKNMLNKYHEYSKSYVRHKFWSNGINNFHIINNGTNSVMWEKAQQSTKKMLFEIKNNDLLPLLEAATQSFHAYQGFYYLRVKMVSKRVNYTAISIKRIFRGHRSVETWTTRISPDIIETLRNSWV